MDTALKHARSCDSLCAQNEFSYTSPLLCKVKEELGEGAENKMTVSLPEDWPWWCVPDSAKVKAEMQADPRWAEWVRKTKE